MKASHSLQPLSRPARIFISTGEVSGDIVGASLSAVILRHCGDARIYGFGGQRMAEAGVRIHFLTSHLGVVGLTEPLALIPQFVRAFLSVRRDIVREKPDVAVLVGQDVANILLSRWLRWKKVRTVCYWPPQVWLWKRLARPIARSYDFILTSYPEEQAVYQRAGGNASFVGHHLRDVLKPVTNGLRASARAKFGLPPGGTVIGLLPGSRDQEIRWLVPALLDGALKLIEKDPSLRFVVPVADRRYLASLEQEVWRRGLAGHIVFSNDSHEAMRACDIAIVASGTATLEAALLGLPMIILYRVSFLTLLGVKLLLACRIIPAQIIGLPNLLAGKIIVPELHQRRASAEVVACEAWSLLSDSRRQTEMKEELRRISATLGENSMEKVARFVLARIERSESQPAASGRQSVDTLQTVNCASRGRAGGALVREADQ
ncbi:MAG TPA: lipid-A-disaccharide synthase [Acidobacteriota bacterium]